MRTILIAALLAPTLAHGAERVECRPEPGADTAAWRYRAEVDGRPDRCFYRGRRKPREELYWPRPPQATPGAGQEPAGVEAAPPAPAEPPEEETHNFDQRWRMK